MRTEDMPVIVLEGSPRQRGRTHGETLRRRIGETVGRWKEALAAAHGRDPDRFIADFLAATHFPAAIARWTPELGEEIDGLAEGAGLDPQTMLALQLMDEDWWYGQSLRTADRCSALGLAGGRAGRPTLLGQTMDLPRCYDGSQALLHVRDDQAELETLVFTWAGLIGLMGVNSAGLGLCVNTLLQLGHRADGLPVSCVARGLLARRSAAEAVEFLLAVDHASGQNYMLADPVAVLSFECSAAAKTRFVPPGPADRVWHTNHPFVNLDRAPGGDGAAEDSPSGRNSRARCRALERRLGDPAWRGDLAAVKEVLGSRDDPADPVSRPVEAAARPTDFCTVGAVIYELGATAVTLHVAAGPPGDAAWRRLSLAGGGGAAAAARPRSAGRPVAGR